MLKGFYAYPDRPSNLAETVENAIKRINNDKIVSLKSWKDISISGKYIINQICNQINKSDLFACDLTYLNPNVLFELGYAIAKDKLIWISIDETIETSLKDFKRFSLLSTIGYSPYSNSFDLHTSFMEEESYFDKENTIFKTSIRSIIEEMNPPTKLFYLKSRFDTEASITLSNRIQKSSLDLTIDDPDEVSIQTLSWYVQNAYSAIAIISHLLSHDHKKNGFYNSKYAFICGLALGFNKPLLMLAHSPYDSPIDFKDLLKIHSTADECEHYAHSWLMDLELKSLKSQKERKYLEHSKKIKARNNLQKLNLGHYMAENESEDLVSYFVQTSIYYEAIKGQQSIIAGRKGTGKTANLYMIANELKNDKRSHVCIIKPVSYELEGILQMLKQAMPISEKGYLIESFWKFLIYTELAKSVYDDLLLKPSYLGLKDEEENFYNFVDKYKEIITSDFSVRLQNAITELCNISEKENFKKHRTKVSEILHDKLISKLRVLLGGVLSGKNKICILVDNLDKAWKKREDIEQLTQLIFGLLSVVKRIEEDFSSSDSKKRSLNLSLILFIRSDILDYVLNNARERDKIIYSQIQWNKEMLLRVIEERFLHSDEYSGYSSELWEKYFCETTAGISTKEYLIDCIIPRPRDAVYYCRAALAESLNNNHTKITETDLQAAEKAYSQYVLDSIMVEKEIETDKIEDILYEFVGANSILDEHELKAIISQANISGDKIDEIINQLLELNFLGIEIKPNEFSYIYNQKDKKIIEALSKKLPNTRYSINRPFHAYLEINTKVDYSDQFPNVGN